MVMAFSLKSRTDLYCARLLIDYLGRTKVFDLLRQSHPPFRWKGAV